MRCASSDRVHSFPDRIASFQVVAVEGVNPSGFTLVAKNVVCSLPPPLAPPAPEAVAAAPVSLVVAAGPFTCSDDLVRTPRPCRPPRHVANSSGILRQPHHSTPTHPLTHSPLPCAQIFEPLEEVFAYCRTHRPDALILLGPFVDAEHPTIASGLIDCTFAELFDLQLRQRARPLRCAADVMPLLRAYLRRIGCGWVAEAGSCVGLSL